MDFFVAKLFTLLTQPALVALIALSLGLIFLARGRRRRLALVLAWGGVCFFLVAGLSPLSNAMISPLEDRFPQPQLSRDAPLDGIIVLGGFEDGWVTETRGGLQVNEAAERITETARLALAFPNAKVVFTGGVGKIWGGGAEATRPVQQFLIDLGVRADRIVLEGASRNTYENAVFTAQILKPQAGSRWLLVTSAFHMPRAMGLFRKAGFPVIAYPVDYKTRGPEDATRAFERVAQGLARFDLAYNEWAGLFAYRLLGRIDDIFPGP